MANPSAPPGAQVRLLHGALMEPFLENLAMKSERSKIINGKLVEEYYWHGKMVVYIDSRLSKQKYDDIRVISK